MKKEETLEMRRKGPDRVHVVHVVCKKHLAQRETASRLDLSVRQPKRLVHRYREQGESGLISRHRGTVFRQRLHLVAFIAVWFCPMAPFRGAIHASLCVSSGSTPRLL